MNSIMLYCLLLALVWFLVGLSFGIPMGEKKVWDFLAKDGIEVTK